MTRILIIMVICLCGLRAGAYTTTTDPELRVWCDMPVFVADGKTVNYITVYEHDDRGIDYSAFNMEFTFPEGLSVNQVKQGRDMVDDIFMSARAAATHSISCNMRYGYNLRIIATSSMNDNLYPDDEDGNPMDELFTVGLIADPSLAPGTYDVPFFGIKFVIRNGDACIPAGEPFMYKMEVVNDTMTGIEDVSTSENESDGIDPDNCYDLLGRRVDPSKVHNTFVISKGRKVFIK